MSTPRGLAILGSTGSIGRSTLEVVALHPEWFRVTVLGAHSSWQAIVEQARVFTPDLVVLGDPSAAAQARAALHDCGSPSRVESGPEALAAAVAGANVDVVMAAIVGAAGLPSTLAAVRASKRVLLANKEALVMAGPLLMDEVRRAGAEIIPIDSEHNAIFQCMPAGYLPGDIARGVVRVILTASGGPFRCAELGSLNDVTPDEACAHPKWKMGRKISVDSATLMNKGLEVIEATLLFGLPETQVDVVVHPQSVVHSLVEYADGSMLAQLGAPDMRTPIAQALAWPARFASGVQSLNLAEIGRLDFEPPDHERFPSLGLARAAARAGGTAPAVLNAANEVAVKAFLDRRLNFTAIAAVIDKVLQRLDSSPVKALGDVLDADAEARRMAEALIEPRRGALA
ncbi:MAG TPA: 1-deoxy-D-xylulose-5-phosphate reductoisomerase [Steroidobacteraceae bacterium]|jgi:1-deoxy-D-xylulose-5-phosphate reductoisomerase|nr:1-deoxy-D-xylulose-5-phosphate reductoisomerase [Steroidobacteraceae bacterium]